MLVKFFKHGKSKSVDSGRSSGGGAVRDYLLYDKDDKTKKRTGATLLRGNPDITTEIINSIKNTKIYTSGVISFAESENPSREQIEETIDSFEATLFPNMRDRVSGYWVQHEDKNRTELHFVYANIDLETGKALPVYYQKSADFYLVDSWKNLTNAKNNWLDPNDPEQARLYKPTKFFELQKAEVDKHPDDNEPLKKLSDEQLKFEIHEKLLEIVKSDSTIQSRADIVKTIEKMGFTVTRVGKEGTKNADSITIKNPTNKRKLKFEGELYSPNFSRNKIDDKLVIKSIDAYRAKAPERLAENKITYETALQHRKIFLEKKLGNVINQAPPEQLCTDEIKQLYDESRLLFDKQVKTEIQAQIDRLKSIVGQHTQEIYDVYKDSNQTKLAEIKQLHDLIIDGLDDMASRQIVPNFDDKVIVYADSKNHVATFDVISNERELAEQQPVEPVTKPRTAADYLSDLKRQLGETVDQDPPPTPTNEVLENSYKDKSFDEIKAEYDKRLKEIAKDLQLADIKDLQEQGKPLLDEYNELTKKQSFWGKFATTIDDVLSYESRGEKAKNIKNEYDKIKAKHDALVKVNNAGKVSKDYLQSAKDELAKLYPNLDRAMTQANAEQQAQKDKEHEEFMTKIRAEVEQREQAKRQAYAERLRSLGVDEIAQNGKYYSGRIVATNENGVIQQVGDSLVLHDRLNKNVCKVGDSWNLDYKDTAKTDKIMTQLQYDFSRYSKGKSKDKGQER